jgi:tryptophan synthase alpha chain
MNRIDKLFKEKKTNILSVYFTAGYPELDSTVTIIKALEASGADMIEIGMPFSDPMADGPVIQNSNQKALRNGMTLKVLFDQLENIRNEVKIPLLLMGYLNPVLQFGMEDFCKRSVETGIDGVILPDLPPLYYLKEHKAIFDKYNLYNILLISPQSTPERIREIDRISKGFVYMVSSSAVTGTRGNFQDDQLLYFTRVNKMTLTNPRLIGFGISNHETFIRSAKYANGGIIGSAFVKALGSNRDMLRNINEFIQGIRSASVVKTGIPHYVRDDRSQGS